MKSKTYKENNKRKLIRWRQYVSYLVHIKIGTISFKKQRDGYNVGRDEYPTTITSALDILIRT